MAPVFFLCAIALLVGGCQPRQERISRQELLSILRSGLNASDPILRAEAVRIAALADDQEVWGDIQDHLQDPQPIVRASAVAALIERDPALVEDRLNSLISPSGEPQARQLLVDLLLAEGTPRIRELTLQAILADPALESVQLVLHHLVDHPADISLLPEARIRQLLQAQDATTLTATVQALVQGGQPDALDAIHADLLADSPDRRMLALVVLARVGSPNAWPHLRWVSRHGLVAEQTWARLALATIGDESVLPEVLEILRSGEQELIPDVLRALVHLPEPELRQHLEAFRNHNRPEIREAAIAGLITLGVPAANLLDLLSDGHPGVVQLAGQTLSQLEPRGMADRLCAALRVLPDPYPVLRFLWSYRETATIQPVIATCQPQLAALLERDDPQVQGLSARLYFATVPLQATALFSDRADQVAVAYAFLEESVRQQPAQFEELYYRFLHHDLLAFRLIASVGLLRIDRSFRNST
ncbi:MAG: hypothetical protein JW797_12080 [Bradymonadales bacterium]|nr:hypothetical protein [Bradymonadales bacterium]